MTIHRPIMLKNITKTHAKLFRLCEIEHDRLRAKEFNQLLEELSAEIAELDTLRGINDELLCLCDGLETLGYILRECDTPLSSFSIYALLDPLIQRFTKNCQFMKTQLF